MSDPHHLSVTTNDEVSPSEAGRQSPSQVVRGEDVVPEYREKFAADATLYHSGQAKLFSANVSQQATPISQRITSMSMHRAPHLNDCLGDLPTYENKFFRTRSGGDLRRGYTVPVSDTQLVLADLVRTEGKETGTCFVRAGPRPRIVFQPSEVTAAIVTCGGLCPGLNDVVSEIVQMLYYNYSVDRIYGIRMGYRGFYDKNYRPFLELNPSTVEGIHQEGGTLLGSSRGGFDCERIIESILEHNITQVYVIGGDGTHRGADILFNEICKRRLKISIIGVPKTIDNDIGIIDRSFGFNTAVEQAEKAVASARVEAMCCPNGVGLVKLMGRHAGFIAAHSTLANRNVDLCLIPEVPLQLEGPKGVLRHIEKTIKKNGFCTIVLAEGAGGDLIQSSEEVDGSGNKKLPEIGKFLKRAIKEYFDKTDTHVSIKYNDPSYMIRSVPANASDSIYCMILAQSAVHGAMAGFTGITAGLVNNRTVYLPMSLISSASPTYLNPRGRTWERVLRTTHQPFTLATKTS